MPVGVRREPSPFVAGLLAAMNKSWSVWSGPSDPGPNGGISFSMLSRFLCCRHRFYLYAVEGLRTVDRWDRRMGYGNMWHVCEESLAKEGPWYDDLEAYAGKECQKYPMQRSEIEHWWMVCQKQFPLYVKYWRNHPDVVDRKPLLSEEVFDHPYKLPSGRTVRLRGKLDSVDLVNGAVWLQENKSKGDIDEFKIRNQLTCDLQSMIYSVVVAKMCGAELFPGKYGGIRYNICRRPLSGGKGSIVQKEPTLGTKCSKCKLTGTVYNKMTGTQDKCPKCNGAGRVDAKPGETRDEYYDRMAKYIEDEPETFFMRWNVDIKPSDIEQFKKQTLTPILEQLCDWWQWVSSKPNDLFANSVHWKYPFGVYNTMLEDRTGDYDNYIQTNSMVGLRRVDRLFTEL